MGFTGPNEMEDGVEIEGGWEVGSRRSEVERDLPRRSTLDGARAHWTDVLDTTVKFTDSVTL